MSPEELSTRLQALEPETCYRFWFSPKVSPWLALHPLTPGGRRAFVRLLRDVKGSPGIAGVLWVDEASRLTFLSPSSPERLIRSMAQLVASSQAQVPAALRLLDARAGELEVDLLDDALIREVVLTAPWGTAFSEHWDALAAYGPAQLAAVLTSSSPGDRFWFWLAATHQEGSPLILQPCSTDPTLARTNALIRRRQEHSAFTGHGRLSAEGVLQLLGRAPTRRPLETLAQWAIAHVDTYPGLSRLKHTELASVGRDRRVREVLAEASLWTDLPDPEPPAPETLPHTASVLRSLRAGTNAGFWMTARGNDGQPFLTLRPQSDGSLGPRLEPLRKRFPRALDRLYGVARRLPSGSWVFTSQERTPGCWSRVVRGLLSDASSTYPAFGELRTAKLLLMDGTAVTRVVDAPAVS